MATRCGLLQIHEGARSDRAADVVFLHGLAGDAVGTWRHDNNTTTWLTWLSEDFEDLGVWALSYPASVVKPFSLLPSWLCRRLFGDSALVGHAMSLPDRARQALNCLSLHGVGDRPVILVGHSLGGLLAKQVLRLSREAAHPEVLLAKETRAVMFLSTPHSGSSLANVVDELRRVAGTTPIVEDLRNHSPNLRELDDWYGIHGRRFEILSVGYYETLKTHGVLVVNPTSARSLAGDPPIPLDEDHQSIAKPANRESQVYQGLVRLCRLVRESGAARGRSSGGWSAGAAGGIAPRPERTTVAEAAEAHALLDSMPTETIPEYGTLPTLSSIRVAPNYQFTGRAAFLRRLARSLRRERMSGWGQIAAITGIGGLGKTEVAREFAHRYGQYFAGGVFWFNFADPEAVAAQIAEAGGVEGMDLDASYRDLSQADQLSLVRSAWEFPVPRLLVFDNCEDEDLLETWAPRTGGCRMLVTSRQPIWSETDGIESHPLRVFTRAESVALLRRLRPDLEKTNTALDRLCDMVGDLPLAICLVGQYLREYQHSPLGTPENYLEELEAASVLEHDSMGTKARSPVGAELHVSRTFAVSYNRLDAEDRADAHAIELLAAASCFAVGEAIPRQLLLAAVARTSQGGDEQALEGSIRRSVALGLINEDRDGQLVLHRLLATYIRDIVPNRTAAIEAVASTLAEYSHAMQAQGHLGPLAELLPHLRVVAEVAANHQVGGASDLLNNLGLYLNQINDQAGARVALSRALSISRDQHGPDDYRVASAKNNLGLVLLDEGDLDGAEAAFSDALRIDRPIFGSDHTKISNRLFNIGLVWDARNKPERAEEYYSQAVDILEKNGDPKIVVVLIHLANKLGERGDFDGEMHALLRALKIARAVLGPSHRDLAQVLDSVGAVQYGQSDLAGAAASLTEAIAILKTPEALGDPLLVTCLKHLGHVEKAAGHLDGARAAFEEALEIVGASVDPSETEGRELCQHLAALSDDGH